MSELSIRACVPADVDALIQLFRDSVRSVARQHYTEAQVLAWAPDEIDHDEWAAQCASRPVWVAVMDAQIDAKTVGFIDLEPDGHIDMLYVHAEHQRRGVASALLGVAEGSARDKRLARLYTEASIPARPFFERRGFRVIAEQVVAIRGQNLINYRMEKLLVTQ